MVNFNFNFDSGTSLQQMVGFETAGRIWSSYLTDNITVNLQVGVSSSLGSNVIGGALPAIEAKQSYTSFTNALNADATSTDDQAALKQVFGSSFGANYKVTLFGTTYQATGTSSSLNLTRADAKALGLPVSGGANGLDGYILLGSLAGAPVQWNYDYTRSAPAPANSLDFLSTALHEIGHVLGFVSGLDSSSWLNTNFGTDISALKAAAAQLDVITMGATPLDLFRYGTNSANLSNTRELSLGGTKVFALSGLSTPIASFSTSINTSQGGNGQQASHWYTDTNALMAPTLKTGTRSAIAATDLKAFDVLGWNVVSSGINTTINLATLQSHSQQSLASRLGQTVNWLNANSTTAAQQLAQDHSQDVYTMAVQSKIYNLSRITPPTPRKSENQSGGQSENQGGNQSLNYEQLFEKQGLFETIDGLTVLSTDSIQPRLETLTWGVESNLSRITPPTRGVPPTPIVELLNLDLNQITLPTPDATTMLVGKLLSPNISRITPPTPGVPPTPKIPPSRSSNTFIGNSDYYYGSSKPAAYEASGKFTQQQVDPLSVLVDFSTVL